MNKLYHQIMSWRFDIVDRLIRASVGLLATATFAASLLLLPNSPLPVTPIMALLLSFAAMAAAIILNVLPIGEFAKKYDELYRLWNAHLGRWNNLATRFEVNQRQKQAEVLRELNELTTDKKHIQSTEPASWRRLLEKCQDEVDIMFFGEKNPLIRRSHSATQPVGRSGSPT